MNRSNRSTPSVIELATRNLARKGPRRAERLLKAAAKQFERKR
jgi:hypothetical protein